jgi:poly [ADP-ribose] polymerase 2/3/4
MASLNYDADKLPLGKLSKKTLQRGNSVLKEISDLLGNPALARSAHGQPYAIALSTFTSRYYSIIPHAFGRRHPPLIDSVVRLKFEAAMIESLGEMEIASEIMTSVLSHITTANHI